MVARMNLIAISGLDRWSSPWSLIKEQNSAYCLLGRSINFMKKSELLFSGLLVPVDFFMLILAGLLAYSIRFSQWARELRPIVFELPFKEYLGLVLLMAPFFIVIFALAGLYNLKTTRKTWEEFSHVAIAASAGVMAVILFTFSIRELFVSRFIIIAAWLLIIILVTLGRLLIKALQHWVVTRFGYGVHRVVLVGVDGVGKAVFEEMKTKPGLGYRIVGRLADFNKKRLEKILKNPGIDEVIQCNPGLSREKNLELVDFCTENRLDFRFIPDLFQTLATNVEIKTLAGVPIVELKKTPLDGWGKIIKRIVDIFGSVVGLLILSPFFLILAVVIKADSPGPVFVRLKRISQGREFYLYKFRSMVKNAEELKKDLLAYNERKDGPLFKMKDDPRVTRVGRFIRKTRIDEFPQLINVLKGEMSLIGPRPHQPDEIARYEKHHKKLLTIKSGMTGLAQISGSSDLSFEEEVKLDTYYIENWSLKMDLQIFLKTFIILFTDKSAC